MKTKKTTTEFLPIYQVCNEENEKLFTGTFKDLKDFAIDQYDLMDIDEEETTKEEVENGNEDFIIEFLENMELDVEKVCYVSIKDFSV